MNALDPVTIDSLPLSEKEKKVHQGRRVLLEEGEKETYLISSGVWAVPVFSVSDEDSTRTPPTYGPHHVMKAAARLWCLLDGKVHEAWKKRAVRLNM
eukprot:13513323-Ditylum_brightwellii.AAC.1